MIALVMAEPAFIAGCASAWRWFTASRVSVMPSCAQVTSKRRKSYPSETRVKRGVRIVHGDVELQEKLGRNDLCVCGSGRRFQGLLHEERPVRRLAAG